MNQRLGVLTSGGDCPGLNAVLRGLVRTAANLHWEVVGFHDGFEGLLGAGAYEALTIPRTAGIMQLGGTILGTTNRGHFVAKVDGGTRATVPRAVIEEARATLARLKIQALVVIGGDGSLTTAQQLSEAGFNVIGVPKTLIPRGHVWPRASTAFTPPPAAINASWSSRSWAGTPVGSPFTADSPAAATLFSSPRSPSILNASPKPCAPARRWAA
jgi:hypothetical protein